MVFAVARQAGWLTDAVSAEHASIGLVTGADRKRFRTRSGGSVKLIDLIDEAVGIGAVKYADLSTARESAYLFDWDRMISFRGNTGPYLQYATARIRSIFRRADNAAGDGDAAVAVTAGPERALALRLLDFGAMVTQLGETAEPHRLCAYLFDVASLFTTFYEECPVLKAEPESLRASRLALCALTLQVLTKGLELLGVPIPDRM